jgi:hypothetical protein
MYRECQYMHVMYAFKMQYTWSVTSKVAPCITVQRLRVLQWYVCKHAYTLALNPWVCACTSMDMYIQAWPQYSFDANTSQ